MGPAAEARTESREGITIAIIANLRRALAARQPRLLSAASKTRAAVAAILHEQTPAPRLLFIERAECEGDPWSGHLAFPGGRVEADDRNPRAATERETLEEIGLDLRPAECLGQLDDLTGSTLPVLVSAFVYRIASPVAFALSPEVEQAFWVPVDRLLDPGRHAERRFPFRGLEDRVLPAIDLLGPGRPVLWGITYRFVAQLLQLTGHELPRPDEKF